MDKIKIRKKKKKEEREKGKAKRKVYQFIGQGGGKRRWFLIWRSREVIFDL